MKQTLHTSRRAFKLALFCLMLMLIGGGNYCLAQEVTLDFTQNGWKLPTDNKKPATKGEYTYNGVTISFDAPKGFYYDTDYLMLRSAKADVGKLTLPAFNFAVEKIEVVGQSEASKSTKENIYVGNTAVSTEKKGSKGTNEFVIDKQNQAAGKIYTLQVSAANARITYIKIYKRAVDLKATTLTLSAIPTEPIAIGGTFSSTPTLKAGEQTLSGKTITWSSDNDKVATVDAATGIVTGVAAGKANITAKFAGDDTYKTSTASYEIIVKGAPALSFPKTSYTIEMGDAFSEPTLQGLPTGVTAKYSSSNADVATIDESTGKVQIVGVGTTTIKAVSEAKDVYEAAEASYELTVNRASSKKVTIDFSTFGLENDKEVGNLKVDGITITFKGKSNLPPKWYNNGTAVRLYSDNQLTISSNNVIRSVIFICDGGGKNMTSENTALSAGVYNAKTNTWDLSGANEKVVTLKNTLSSGHFRIQKIIVTTELPTSVGTITIATPEGFGTYYNSNSYILPEGLTAFGYKEANTNGTLVKTDEFTGGDVVPANAALVVKGNEGEYECYATDKEATKTLEGNLLKGVAAYKEIPVQSGFKRYVLTTVNGQLGFYRTKSGNIKVPANRAYLELTEAQAQAVSFFQLDGETTGIATATTKEAPKAIYTLSGVRLKATTTQGLPAGAYVVNGKVVIIK